VEKAKITVLALLVLCGILFAPPACRGADGSVEEFFRQALTAEGEEYLQLRTRLISLGTGAKAFLERQRSAKTWQERLLAEILLERLAHEAEIRAAVAAALNYAQAEDDSGKRYLVPPGMSAQEYKQERKMKERVLIRGKALAERFKGLPLVLVEFLWKGNELKNLRRRGKKEEYPLRDSVEGPAYGASALTFFGEKKALPVLLHVLEHSESGPARTFAGEAISYLRMPEAVDDLLRIAGSELKSAAEECGRIAARNALASCCTDEASVVKLRNAAAKTKDPALQLLLAVLLQAAESRNKPYKMSPVVRASYRRDAFPSIGPLVLDETAASGGTTRFWLGFVIGVLGGVLLPVLALRLFRRKAHRGGVSSPPPDGAQGGQSK